MNTAFSDYQSTRMQLEALQRASDATSPQTAWASIERMCHDMGFDYAGIGRVGRSEGEAFIDLDYASTFFENAFDSYKRDSLHLHDLPVEMMARGTEQTHTIDILLSAPRNRSEDAQRVLDFFARHNIGCQCALMIDLPETPDL